MTFGELRLGRSHDVVLVDIRELVLRYEAESGAENLMRVSVVLLEAETSARDVDSEPFQREAAHVDRLSAISRKEQSVFRRRNTFPFRRAQASDQRDLKLGEILNLVAEHASEVTEDTLRTLREFQRGCN